MKKTLAAVLAAMMALSTATVALAKDTDVDGDLNTGIGTLVAGDSPVNEDVRYGKTERFALQITDANKAVVPMSDLGQALAAGQVKIDVTVTVGRSLLKSAPKVDLHLFDRDGDKKGDEYRAVLKLDVKHTYNTDVKGDTDKTDIAVRVRVTSLYGETDTATIAKKGYVKIAGLENKGDTLSIDEITFDAIYEEILAYGKDMTITASEVSTNNVVMKGSKLVAKLDEKDTETATFYFGDTAAFTAKISEAQKDVNLFYETKVADAYYEEYPELAFEAIQFLGTPKFLRKGTLTFNAIGDDETTVYEVTSDGLVEREIADYDATYGIVTVEGISTLTSYLVASEALEVEAEVEAAPEVEEENPNTGAC